MKKIVLISIGVLLFIFSKAQEPSDYFSKQNEINIGYLNLLSLNNTSTFGVGYKRDFGEGALRMRVNYNYRNEHETWTDQTNDYSSSNFLPRLGYEFRLKFRRSMVMYGIDLCASYYQNENTRVSYNGSSNDDDSYISSNEKTTSGYGFSPFLGYKFYINKFISISTETSFDFLYSKGITKSLNSNDGVVSSENKSVSETITAKLSPVGIFSINFHF